VTPPRVLAVCGDAGGAAAVAPVLGLTSQSGAHVVALGYRQSPDVLAKFAFHSRAVNGAMAAREIEEILRTERPHVLVTGTSMNPDQLECAFIAAARRLGVSSLAVLDFWTSYAERWIDRDGVRQLPDRIAVMDQRAHDGLVRAGIDPARITITGQPAFDGLAEARAAFGAVERHRVRAALGLHDGELAVAFVSQPLLALYGADPAAPNHPGYTEVEALHHLTAALNGIARDRGCRIALIVRRHPREERAPAPPKLSDRVRLVDGEHVSKHELAMAVDVVTGMTRALLVEAVVLAAIVLSVQPGMRGADPLPFAGSPACIYDAARLRETLEPLLLDPFARSRAQTTTGAWPEPGATRRLAELVLQMMRF
jgi:hypothetical protein